MLPAVLEESDPETPSVPPGSRRTGVPAGLVTWKAAVTSHAAAGVVTPSAGRVGSQLALAPAGRTGWDRIGRGPPRGGRSPPRPRSRARRAPNDRGEQACGGHQTPWGG